jgi:hypothetical protein
VVKLLLLTLVLQDHQVLACQLNRAVGTGVFKAAEFQLAVTLVERTAHLESLAWRIQVTPAGGQYFTRAQAGIELGVEQVVLPKSVWSAVEGEVSPLTISVELPSILISGKGIETPLLSLAAKASSFPVHARTGEPQVALLSPVTWTLPFVSTAMPWS